jgi:hypothetical protein
MYKCECGTFEPIVVVIVEAKYLIDVLKIINFIDHIVI